MPALQLRGQLKGFSYGNGINFSQVLNTRGLPDSRRDSYGSVKTLDYGYDYDVNGNVKTLDYGYDYDVNGNLVGLSDGLGIDNREMGYDDLDRLTNVNGPGGIPTYEGVSDYSE